MNPSTPKPQSKKPSITFTERTVEKLNEVIAANQPFIGLRLQITGRAHGRFEHVLSIVQEGEPVDEDDAVESSGLRVYVEPRSAPYVDGRPMAPHITFWIVARGINIGLHTRLYFGDEDEANAADPVLARIEHRVRVPTLIAERGEENGQSVYTFDIRLQGEDETVFFDI